MDWLAFYSLVVVATCWTVLIGVAAAALRGGLAARDHRGEGRPVAKNRGKPDCWFAQVAAILRFRAELHS